MPTRQHEEPRPPATPDRPASSSEWDSLADERKWLVEAALSRLVERDREILIRYYLHEQSQDRICAEMGLTETQFRLLKSRAMARFGELNRELTTRKRLIKTAITHAAHTEDPVVGIDRVVPIVAHAVAVFGDEQKASHWLATPLGLLGNRSPVQLLAGGGDIEAVDQILTRIEHNIPS